jgi:hypothetical protein
MLTIVAPDKGAKDCAWLRHALLSDSLAGELERYTATHIYVRSESLVPPLDLDGA